MTEKSLFHTPLMSDKSSPMIFIMYTFKHTGMSTRMSLYSSEFMSLIYTSIILNDSIHKMSSSIPFSLSLFGSLVNFFLISFFLFLCLSLSFYFCFGSVKKLFQLSVLRRYFYLLDLNVNNSTYLDLLY